jgi:hypothetical protein
VADAGADLVACCASFRPCSANAKCAFWSEKRPKPCSSECGQAATTTKASFECLTNLVGSTQPADASLCGVNPDAAKVHSCQQTEQCNATVTFKLSLAVDLAIIRVGVRHCTNQMHVLEIA